jgi:hypothetical protein
MELILWRRGCERLEFHSRLRRSSRRARRRFHSQRRRLAGPAEKRDPRRASEQEWHIDKGALWWLAGDKRVFIKAVASPDLL